MPFLKKLLFSLCEYRHNNAFLVQGKKWKFGIIHKFIKLDLKFTLKHLENMNQLSLFAEFLEL